MKRTLLNLPVKILMTTTLVIGITVPAFAASDDPECLDGQYVLGVSTVSSLREKAIEDINAVSPVPIGVDDESNHALLVEETQDPGQSALTPCSRLRMNVRNTLRRNRVTGSHKIARRYSCSCNAVIHAENAPNDPYYYLEWGLNQSNNIDMNLPEAWDMSTGSRNVVVGVIDTGADYNHPDLAANIWHNPAEVPGNGVDDDRNGIVDDYYGYNPINDTGNPLDDNGHGTHVSGTIGALGNNAVGVTGVNWQVTIIPVKFLDANGSGSTYNALKGIDYLTYQKQHGVNVVASNNSWGGGGFSQPLYDAIARARDAGILFIAAAGNSGRNIDTSPSYPASYDVTNIISVAAIDSNGALASFSNYGAASVDIAAPGVTIASLYPNNGYVYLSGTSMATPHVTGAVALLKSYAANLSMTQVRDRLYATGTAMSVLQPITSTGKLVNTYELLRGLTPVAPPSGGTGATPAPTATPSPTPTPAPTPGPTNPPTASPTPSPSPTPGRYVISGQTRVNGVPVPSVRLELTTVNGKVVKYSSSSGQYSFDPMLSPINYSISATKNGYTFPTVSGVLNSNKTIFIDGAAKTFTLTALVMSGDKTKISGATVSAGSFGTATTNSSGIATFQIPFGTDYTLSVAASGYSFGSPIVIGKIRGNVTRVFVGAQ